MNFRDTIDDIILCKLAAIKYKISYDVAKILDFYLIFEPDELNIKAAEELNKIFKKNNISFETAKKFMRPRLDSYLFSWNENRFYDNEVKKFNFPKEVYECGLRSSYFDHNINMRSYFNEEEIKTINETSLYLISEGRNVSKTTAYYIAYLSDVAFAKTMGKAVEWNRKTNEIDFDQEKALPDLTLINKKMKNYLLHSGEFKSISKNGFQIISDNEKCLNILCKVVDNFSKEVKPEFVETFLKQAKKSNLIITDKSFWSENIARIHVAAAYYKDKHKMIVLNRVDEHEIDDLVNSLIHEASHFLDNSLPEIATPESEIFAPDKHAEFIKLFNRIYNSTYSLNFEEMPLENNYPNILQRAIVHPVNLLEKGFNNTFFRRTKAVEYVTSRSMCDKWIEEINKKNPQIDKKSLKTFLRQKQKYEYSRYLIASLCLGDIYDAISDGRLADTIFYGHGSRYYSDFDAKIKEFIANISTMINLGCEDVLNYEFGPELASDIIKVFNDTILKPFEDEPLDQISFFDDNLKR